MAASTALVIRHVAFEDAAGFREPIEAAGYSIGELDAGRDDLAALDWSAPDLLVVMGGPMGVYERVAHPWLDDEVRGIATRIAAGRPTLGVCLGSQLIAAALGARVYPGPVKEVGFAPVALTAAGEASPLAALRGVPLLHWHGDTFDLPDGAERLAMTAAYPNQAFRVGSAVLAVQFHAEIGAEADIERWLAGADDYLAAAGTHAAAVRGDHARLGPAAAAAGRRAIGDWLASLA